MQIDVPGKPRRSKGVPGLTFVWFFTAKRAPSPRRAAARVWALLAVKTTRKSTPGPFPAGPGSSIIHHVTGPGVLEGSLAGCFVRRFLALELISGDDFSCKLMCGAGPGDLGGSRGSASAENPGKTGPIISSKLYRAHREIGSLHWTEVSRNWLTAFD